jgi:hypothetical protein
MLAEFEADRIPLRTREGMAVAEARGRLKGKKPKLFASQRRHLLDVHAAGVRTQAERAGRWVQVNTERGVLQRFARAPMRTVRAADLADAYAHPGPELVIRLRRGVAHGIYCAVSPEHVGSSWRPTIEAAAAAIATVLYGDRVPVLTGLTAARMHRALPRAISVGCVAVPTQHRTLRLADRDGEVRFVMCAVAELDAIAMATDLGQTLVTTPEQTVVDLALLEKIAGRQRMRATLERVGANR